MSELIVLLKEILENKTEQQVAAELNLASGTVKRWVLLNNVPRQYYFDLMSMTNQEIDLESLSFRDKDQFFTPQETVEECLLVFKNKLKELGIDENELNYIEPSAGSGAFFNLLPSDRKIGLDIEPQCANIIKHNFLEWSPQTMENNVVIGNPPFGLRGNMALRFINHAAKFADFVVFILPQLFESDGKGSPMLRVDGLNLIHSQKIRPEFEYPDGEKIKVKTIFQIWSKNFGVKNNKETCKTYMRILSLSDGGTPGTTRNKKWLDKCDLYIPSTCYGENKMKVYYSFEDLPNRKGYGIVFHKDKNKLLPLFEKIQWSKVAFKSTNSAMNLRSSLIEKELINNGYRD